MDDKKCNNEDLKLMLVWLCQMACFCSLLGQGWITQHWRGNPTENAQENVGCLSWCWSLFTCCAIHQLYLTITNTIIYHKTVFWFDYLKSWACIASNWKCCMTLRSVRTNCSLGNFLKNFECWTSIICVWKHCWHALPRRLDHSQDTGGELLFEHCL